jgi:hypothetical protein
MGHLRLFLKYQKNPEREERIMIMIILTMAIMTNQNQINQKKVKHQLKYHLLAEIPFFIFCR